MSVAEHVGHRWAKDATGIYCKCKPGHVERLYAFGSPSNSRKRQTAIATAMDALREAVLKHAILCE